MERIAPIKFFSGRASTYLAEKIAMNFGTELGRSSVFQFSDGEFQPAYDESVRGCTVFIVQSTFPPGDNLLELLMMVDAAKRASADKVVAVIPYFGFARQDRKDRPRSSIGAKLVANLLTAAGVDRIMTIDLHADQLRGSSMCLLTIFMHPHCLFPIFSSWAWITWPLPHPTWAVPKGPTPIQGS